MNYPFKLFINGSFACLVFWLAACKSPQDPAPTTRNAYYAEVPLTITYDPTHYSVTPTIPITINGVTNNVILDTGSWGLRILPGALKNANLVTTQKLLSYSYGSGINEIYIRGRQASGTFTVGSVSSTMPLNLMLIDTIRRSLTDPGRSPLDSVTIPNPHFRNFAGILGVGMRNSSSLTVASPLAQLPGANSFIVDFPAYGQALGKLILNPDAIDLSGFTYFPIVKGLYPLPNGLPSWLDSQVNGVISIGGNVVRAPTLLDSGTSSTLLFASGLASYGYVTKGVAVDEGVGQPGQSVPVLDLNFTVTSYAAGKDLVYTYQSTADNQSLIYGTNFFFAFDVYYDQQNGRIGLRKK